MNAVKATITALLCASLYGCDTGHEDRGVDDGDSGEDPGKADGFGGGDAADTLFSCRTAAEDSSGHGWTYAVPDFNNLSQGATVKVWHDSGAGAEESRPIGLAKIATDTWSDGSRLTVRLTLRSDGARSIEVEDEEAGVTARADNGFCESRSLNRGATVLLLHGYHSRATRDGVAWDCADFWANQRDHLDAVDVTGPVLTAGYYTGNTNCDRNVESTVYTKDFAGDVTLEEGQADSVLTRDTPLTHVAYRFAWLVAKENADNGAHPVRVITDSLGGLVVRWATLQSSLGNPNYPSLEQMNLDRVVAAGSPHEGVPLAAAGDIPFVGDFFAGAQAHEARPHSATITALMADPRVGTAHWYSLTSRFNALPSPGDGFISNQSACFVGSECIRYRNPAYVHGAYLNDERGEPRHRAVEWGSPGNWSDRVDAPGAARLAAELTR